MILRKVDAIFKKNLKVKLGQERAWRYFYRSLEIVIVFWLVTIVAITTEPWIDYWVKSQINERNSAQVLGEHVRETPSEVVINNYEEDEPHFYLKNSKTEISAPIVEGIDDEALKKGIGHHPESVWPDSKGNVVLAGSNTELDLDNPFREVFRNLRDVDVTDRVTIEYKGKKYLYEIFRREVIKPDDSRLFEQVDDWLLTFYTCDPPYTDWKRLVFQAKLIKIE